MKSSALIRAHSRRQFIKQVSAAGLGLGLMSLSPVAAYGRRLDSGQKRITIMHTNDTHARIEPFPDGSGRYANMGGTARRAALIKKIRQAQPHNLLLDAGDVFQGTPYFNFYEGALDYELMSMMGYDASTIGNHEFDNKVEGFVEVAPKARFPFVISNYDFSGAPAMGAFTRPHLIKHVDGVRIGIFGLGVAFKNLVLPHLHQGVQDRDAIATASEMTQRLRQDFHCDMVICLSHLGYRYDDPEQVSDQIVANQVHGIDLIIGGHTHTLLDEPEIVEKAGDAPTVISQVGHGGVVLGRLDFEFTRTNRLRGVSVANQSIDASI
ncbi:MAG: twin-arginine translocation signal domain-containing protein [Puniceicoccaceae bacterium]|nr:MAG: twin-arginine translocation signal domain-containing protein [Puniceicoccaceae bacterium]